jgi:hypothetical protein
MGGVDMVEAEPDGTGPAGGLRRRRLIGMAVFVAALLGWCLVVGLPTDPIQAVVWLGLAAVAWNNHQRWTYHLRFVRDWLPVLLFLVIYTYSRGWAYTPSTAAHVYEMISMDHAIFGVTPTVWLQQHLYDPHHIYPWDVAVSFVYFSHFVTIYVVTAVLWIRNRPLWAAFMRRWMLLTAAGLSTYLLWPAAPPWWAAKYGLIEPVARLSSRGWAAIGLHGAGNVMNHAQLGSNPVAAMPSLHFAFSLCAVAFFFNRVRKRFIPLLCLYPLAMGFTLSYTGEHHVTDMLAGALYVGASYLLVWLGERWWRQRRERLAAQQLMNETSGPSEPAEAGEPADEPPGDPTPVTRQESFS